MQFALVLKFEKKKKKRVKNQKPCSPKFSFGTSSLLYFFLSASFLCQRGKRYKLEKLSPSSSLFLIMDMLKPKSTQPIELIPPVPPLPTRKKNRR